MHVKEDYFYSSSHFHSAHLFILQLKIEAGSVTRALIALEPWRYVGVEDKCVASFRLDSNFVGDSHTFKLKCAR